MSNTTQKTFADFKNTIRLSGGQYSAVKGYRSQRGSVADFLLRPGVSKAHRLRNSIEWAQRLNALEVAQAVNAKYGTDTITPSDAQRYITAQIESWMKSQEGPQRANPFLTLQATKNGAPVLEIKPQTEDLAIGLPSLYFVGQSEGYNLIEEGEPKKAPKSDSARVKDWVRGRSTEGQYRRLKLDLNEVNFDAVCIGGEMFTPQDLRRMVMFNTAALMR